MILSALADYYQRLLDDPESGISAPGYSREKIGYTVVLATNGNVISVDDEHRADGKKRLPKSVSVPASFKRPGTGAKSFFLWDKTSYVLGISASSKRSEQEHAAFKALHYQALSDTDDPGLHALLAFIERWTPDGYVDHPAFARTARLCWMPIWSSGWRVIPAICTSVLLHALPGTGNKAGAPMASAAYVWSAARWHRWHDCIRRSKA